MKENKDRQAFPSGVDGGPFGMNKREFFAALIMAGFAANSGMLCNRENHASMAIERADELLRLLETADD